MYIVKLLLIKTISESSKLFIVVLPHVNGAAKAVLQKYCLLSFKSIFLHSQLLSTFCCHLT